LEEGAMSEFARLAQTTAESRSIVKTIRMSATEVATLETAVAVLGLPNEAAVLRTAMEWWLTTSVGGKKVVKAMMKGSHSIRPQSRRGVKTATSTPPGETKEHETAQD
jgi:hypothetical protein